MQPKPASNTPYYVMGSPLTSLRIFADPLFVSKLLPYMSADMAAQGQLMVQLLTLRIVPTDDSYYPSILSAAAA